MSIFFECTISTSKSHKSHVSTYLRLMKVVLIRFSFDGSDLGIVRRCYQKNVMELFDSPYPKYPLFCFTYGGE